MEAQFNDDLRLLTNALRQATFRFILIGHNRYSLYKDIAARIESSYPTRTVVLLLTGKNYRQIADEIASIKSDIVLIPDFGWLFQSGNEDTCVAFNQRRDAFARLNIAFVCFIEPNEFTQVPNKVPDWWSLRSLELDFHRDSPKNTGLIQVTDLEKMSSLGGQTKEEKEAEIGRILQQIEGTDPQNKTLRASLFLQVGGLFHDLSLFEESLAHIQMSLTLSQEANDRYVVGSSLNNIGQLFFYQGQYKKALSYFQQSLQIKKEIGDPSGVGNVLNNISQIYSSQGDYSTALFYLQDSLTIQQRIGDQRGESRVLNNLASLCYFQKDFKTALKYLEQSLQIQRNTGDLSSLGTTLQNIGQVNISQGDYSTALNYFQQSLLIRQRIGDQRGESTTLNNIAQVYDELGDKNAAINYFQMSLPIRQRIGDQNGEAITLINIGVTYLEQSQNIAKAIPLFKQAIDILEQLKSPDIKIAQDYLNAIRKQIGDERYNELIQSV